MTRKRLVQAISIGTVLAVVVGAAGGATGNLESTAVATDRLCTSGGAARIPQPTARHLAAAGLKRLPVAEDQASRSPRAARLELDRRHEPALPDQQPAVGDLERQGRRQVLPSRDDASSRHAGDRMEARQLRPDAGVPVRRISRRAHRGGRTRLLRAGRRRICVVLRRGRLQLRCRCRGGHLGHVARREGRAGGDDHARRTKGQRRPPTGEHPRPRLRRRSP